MFVYNLKISNKKFIKTLAIFLGIVITILILYSIYSIFKSSKENNLIETDEITEITTQDFTRFLKNSHEKIDDYLGKKYKMSGYVYRMPDFNENQFVLSRTMVLDSNNGVIVGILSEYENAKDLNDGDWITVTGEIIKGNYNGEMPTLKINEITKSNPSENEYVYPPTNELKI